MAAVSEVSVKVDGKSYTFSPNNVLGKGRKGSILGGTNHAYVARVLDGREFKQAELKEAIRKLAGLFPHLSLLKVVDAVFDETRCVIVGERASGHSLLNQLDDPDLSTRRVRFDIIRQLVDVMCHLHNSNDQAHGNLSPSDIFVVRRAPDGENPDPESDPDPDPDYPLIRVQISDVGLVAALCASCRSSMKMTEFIRIDAVNYLAPEIFKESLTAKIRGARWRCKESDVFSLGKIIKDIAQLGSLGMQDGAMNSLIARMTHHKMTSRPSMAEVSDAIKAMSDERDLREKQGAACAASSDSHGAIDHPENASVEEEHVKDEMPSEMQSEKSNTGSRDVHFVPTKNDDQAPEGEDHARSKQTSQVEPKPTIPEKQTEPTEAVAHEVSATKGLQVEKSPTPTPEAPLTAEVSRNTYKPSPNEEGRKVNLQAKNINPNPSPGEDGSKSQQSGSTVKPDAAKATDAGLQANTAQARATPRKEVPQATPKIQKVPPLKSYNKQTTETKNMTKPKGKYVKAAATASSAHGAADVVVPSKPTKSAKSAGCTNMKLHLTWCLILVLTHAVVFFATHSCTLEACLTPAVCGDKWTKLSCPPQDYGHIITGLLGIFTRENVASADVVADERAPIPPDVLPAPGDADPPGGRTEGTDPGHDQVNDPGYDPADNEGMGSTADHVKVTSRGVGTWLLVTGLLGGIVGVIIWWNIPLSSQRPNNDKWQQPSYSPRLENTMQLHRRGPRL